jgi:hypothetical protein
MPIPHRSLIALGALALACHSLSSQRIASLKASPEGREKLVQALRDGAVATDRRAEAAAALTEVGWVDRVESAVAGLGFEDRARLIPAVALLVARDLDASDGNRAGDAREALFALRRQATTDEATRTIDDKLLPALERDLRAGRSEGRHPPKEMLIAAGALGGPVAGRVIADPKAPFDVAVEVLDKVGDKAAREAGGAALVDRARGGAPLTPALWKALSTLGGARVTTYLEEKIEHGADSERDEAARTLVALRRDPKLLPFALRLARDTEARPVVRREMLGLVQSLGGDEAKKGLLGLIAGDPEPSFRYAAFEALVKGDAKSVLPALEAMPLRGSYDPVSVHEQLVKPLAHMGWPAREGIFKALQSSSPLARLTAVWTLEKVGFASDAAALVKLAGDQARIKGIPTPIGAEASRVAAGLKKPAT